MRLRAPISRAMTCCTHPGAHLPLLSIRGRCIGFLCLQKISNYLLMGMVTDDFLGKVPLIWGNALSRHMQCQGVKGFSLMTLEPKDGGGESRPALCVLQPCSPRCTFEGREGQMWMVGMWHSAPGKTGQREGVKLADINRPGRILFHPFSLYSRLLNIQGSLLVIVWISNDPQRPNS